MARTIVMLLIPVVLFFYPGSVSSQTAPPANETREADEIVRLLREWGDAMARRDVQALGRLLAEDFTFVSPRGRLIKKPAYVANRDASGVFASEVARFDDVAVRLHGNIAVVTSRYTSKAQANDASIVQEQIGEYTRTDTWIKVNGRWQAIATQLTPLNYSGAHVASDSAALHGLNGDELKWSESPVFPGARVAVLYGMPYTGGYAIRMRRPNGHVEKPHYHESDEHLSVVSGIVYVGVGDGSNRASARTFRAGGYVVIPARTLHYSWAEGEVLEDVHWSGPAAALSIGGPR